MSKFGFYLFDYFGKLFFVVVLVLGVFGFVVGDVVGDVVPGVEVGGGTGEGDDPDAEDGLDLAEEVEELGAEGDVVDGVVVGFGGGGAPLAFNLFAVLVLEFVGDFVERTGGEGVEDGEEEDDGGDEVERVFVDPGLEFFADGHRLCAFGVFGLGVLAEGEGKVGLLDGVAVLVDECGVGMAAAARSFRGACEDGERGENQDEKGLGEHGCGWFDQRNHSENR